MHPEGLQTAKKPACMGAITGLDYGLYLSVLCMKYEFLVRCLMDFRGLLSSKDQSRICIPQSNHHTIDIISTIMLSP